MAIIFRNKEGVYINDCPICGQRLADPVYATSHFIVDRSHPLWPYSDAGMHWGCYAAWEHQREFADLLFDTECRSAEGNGYWEVVYKDGAVLLTYGLVVAELDVMLRHSGSSFRVALADWPKWVAAEWQNCTRHQLEQDALTDVAPRLAAVSIPKGRLANTLNTVFGTIETLTRRP